MQVPFTHKHHRFSVAFLPLQSKTAKRKTGVATVKPSDHVPEMTPLEIMFILLLALGNCRAFVSVMVITSSEQPSLGHRSQKPR